MMNKILFVALTVMLFSGNVAAAGNDRALTANGTVPSKFFGEVSAGEQDKQGVLKYSYVSSYGVDFTALSIKVLSPLDDTKISSLASLDGLANTNSIELEYYRGISGFGPFAYESEMAARCRAANIPDLSCDSSRLATALDLSEAALDREIQQKIENTKTFEYSLSAKTGTEKFEYFSANSIKDSQRERSYSFTAQAGWRMRSSSLGASITRERSYTPDDDITLCSPLDMSLLSCQTLPGTSPMESTGNIARVEYKRWSGSYGYSVKLSHNDESSVTGIEIPVYFVLDPNDKWGGGVKFGWRDDTNDFGASFFVGMGW